MFVEYDERKASSIFKDFGFSIRFLLEFDGFCECETIAFKFYTSWRSSSSWR